MISVCMPTYNGELFIKDQLDSILLQLSSQDEIIISDDSSTDNTVKIIKNYQDSRIKLLEGNRFHSPIFNMENALVHAKGDYIFLSDQDDIWLDNKVEVMMRYLNNHDCVVSDAVVVDANLKELHPSYFEIRKCHTGIVRNIVKNGYIGCCMAFRRSLLDKIIPFPRSIPMHDMWIGINAERYGKSIFINDKLIKYRRHESNASATGEKSQNTILRKMKYRIDIVSALLMNYRR